VRAKHFYFDSSTHLLVEVDYFEKRSDGSSTAVRIQRSNWMKSGGQMVPGLITRLENGSPVTTLTVNSAVFSAQANDTEFSLQ
jgi:hypothetical protein